MGNLATARQINFLAISTMTHDDRKPAMKTSGSRPRLRPTFTT
jgi:hypothetical protein